MGTNDVKDENDQNRSSRKSATLPENIEFDRNENRSRSEDGSSDDDKVHNDSRKVPASMVERKLKKAPSSDSLSELTSDDRRKKKRRYSPMRKGKWSVRSSKSLNFDYPPVFFSLKQTAPTTSSDATIGRRGRLRR